MQIHKPGGPRTDVTEITGHEAAKYLRTKNPGMDVLMLAGLPEDDRIRNSAALKRFDIFPPPFPAARLIKKGAGNPRNSSGLRRHRSQ
jgi:hypothetical protein